MHSRLQSVSPSQDGILCDDLSFFISAIQRHLFDTDASQQCDHFKPMTKSSTNRTPIRRVLISPEPCELLLPRFYYQEAVSVLASSKWKEQDGHSVAYFYRCLEPRHHKQAITRLRQQGNVLTSIPDDLITCAYYIIGHCIPQNQFTNQL